MASKRITWDPKKAASNVQKHRGVSFEEAATVLDDEHAEWSRDWEHGEARLNVLGVSSKERLLFVVTIVFEEDAFHIISARKATKHERKRYEEGE